MPELPEVELVRSGLERTVLDATVGVVEVYRDRAVRRHAGGVDDFTERLRGARLLAVCRRGKYLWMPIGADEALVAHLGMSGQMLVVDPATPAGPHLRVRCGLSDRDGELRFVDQRTFGGLYLDRLGADGIPASVAHIAPDPFEPSFDAAAVLRRLRARKTGLKRAMLDQGVVSGIGNIYADEALWRARLHWARPTETLPPARGRELLGHVRTVMAEAIAAGGTSFDSLYVRVNGQSGYFDRALSVYGRGGKECPRCAAVIRREAFMNRSSFRCPRCQPTPRAPRW